MNVGYAMFNEAMGETATTGAFAPAAYGEALAPHRALYRKFRAQRFAELIGQKSPAAFVGNPLLDLIATENQPQIKQFLKFFTQGKAKPEPEEISNDNS